jgi:hypothetical protein
MGKVGSQATPYTNKKSKSFMLTDLFEIKLAFAPISDDPEREQAILDDSDGADEGEDLGDEEEAGEKEELDAQKEIDEEDGDREE